MLIFMVFGHNNSGKKIVLSGTYGTGKTTATRELSRLTGLPPAVARGMRDILPETFPGKKLEQCSPFELVQLGMVRFGERRILENQFKDGFISDGSAVHEWAYGHGRMLEGANGKGSEIFGEGYKFAIDAFGEVVKRYSAQNYTHVIHFPVEFPLPQDGHRPVSEAFRQKADEILRETWANTSLPFYEVSGSVEERITKVVNLLGLDVSTTLNGPKQKEGGKLWYDRADDALGPSSDRFFSSGFRKTQHDIYDIEIDPASGILTAKADLSYLGSWSKKSGNECRPHLSSIDSILLSGQLAQMLLYSQDSVSREESKNLWLRDLTLNPGCKPIEDVQAIPMRLEIIKSCKPRLCGKYWHTANVAADLGNGAFQVSAKVGYELPERFQKSS